VLIRWSSALKAVLQGVSALEGSLQRVGPLEDSRLTVRLCGGRSSVAMGPQGSWGVGPSSRHQLPRTPCERYTRSPSTPSATPARNFPSLFGGAREFCTISHTKSFVGKDFPTSSPCEWFRCRPTPCGYMKGVSASEKVKSVKVVQRLRCSVAMIYRLPPFGYSECACCNELCITESCAGMPAFTPRGACRCRHERPSP